MTTQQDILRTMMTQLDEASDKIPAYNANKAKYNKEWREKHVEYHRQKSREHYKNNVELYRVKNALYRLGQGKNVSPELIEKLQVKNKT